MSSSKYHKYQCGYFSTFQIKEGQNFESSPVPVSGANGGSGVHSEAARVIGRDLSSPQRGLLSARHRASVVPCGAASERIKKAKWVTQYRPIMDRPWVLLKESQNTEPVLKRWEHSIKDRLQSLMCACFQNKSMPGWRWPVITDTTFSLSFHPSFNFSLFHSPLFFSSFSSSSSIVTGFSCHDGQQRLETVKVGFRRRGDMKRRAGGNGCDAYVLSSMSEISAFSCVLVTSRQAGVSTVLATRLRDGP